MGSNSYKVKSFGQHYPDSGWGVHFFSFFEALGKIMPVSMSGKVPRDVAGSLQANNSDFIEIYTAIIKAGGIPFFLQRPGRKIFYTTFEVKEIYPKNLIDQLAEFENLWTTSHWNKQELVQLGLSEKCIEVVPEGIDATLFHPNYPSIRSKLGLPENAFVFFSNGASIERKNQAMLVKAFDAVFADRKDAYLFILAKPNERCQKLTIPELAKQCHYTMDRIIHIPKVPDRVVIPHILNACDCGVFPYRAEGWCLPLIEAMACGLPTIATNYSAPTEYISSEVNILLDYKLADIEHDTAHFETLPGAKWAEPDFEQLKAHMDWVYRNRDAAREMGLSAAQYVKEHWLWDHAALKAKSLLDDLML